MATSYRAIEQEDGTFRIKDVPIFSLLPENANRQGLPEIDRDWLARAVQLDQFRRSMNGYKATLHVGHHDAQSINSGLPNVGFVELTRVGDHQHDGETTVAIFADLIVNRRAMDQILANELPGRSAEPGRDEPEIRSLALLTSQPPFLRFAQLRSDTVVIEELATVGEAVAAGFSACATFADLSVSIDSDKAETKDDDPPAKGDEAPAENPDAAKPEEDDDGDDEETIDMAQFEALKGEIDTIKSSMESMSTTMSALVAKLSPDDESEPGGDPAATFADDATPATFAELQGRIAGLESRIDETAKAATAERLAADAAKDLTDGNWLVTDKVMESLATFAAMGEEPLAKFVESFKETAKDITPSLDDALTGVTEEPETTDLLAKFSEHEQSVVLAASADFDRLSGALPGFKSTREDFVRSRLSTVTPAATA